MTRFVIIAAPRTGSTMLRLMLNSHPDICAHGEIFAERMPGFVGLENKVESPLRQWLRQVRDQDPKYFLWQFAFSAGTAKVVGFKILYANLSEERLEAVLHELLADRSIKIVHLTRRNRLRRLLSHRRVLASGVTVVVDRERLPRHDKVAISYDELCRDAVAIQREEELTRNRFTGHEVFEIAYEDIMDPGSSVLRTSGVPGYRAAGIDDAHD